MTDIRAQLQSSLGAAYTIERELGGGGMSRVFLANETALSRRVVVKVLSPELSAGINVDRFKREIQLAAKLQHPQIVPVLTTGETEGLPFYTMPFVDGESLRARVTRGALGITEAVGILRDVARALAFAHKQGVVHRDIKPENVLLSEGSATVADFGIAKALSASKASAPGGTLTMIGTSLGTPAYMAPEQVAGDPNTDHRADLYAFGCVAYELLTGRTPFTAPTPQKLLAAHLGETPRPVSELRPDTPASLAELVMRCLAKDAADRPESANVMLSVLDSATGSSERMPMPAVLMGGPGAWKRALGIYAAAFVVVAVLTRAAIVGIGLPDWVFPGALIVMALGLPVILVTAYVHRVTQQAMVMTPALTAGGSRAPQGTMATMALKAAPHVSWRRAGLGGIYAFGAFIVLIAAWMVMRALGIGPAASLMAAGKLGERERVILADFKGPATDSLLGPTVTEAFRTDLAQSANLSVMPASAVREVLRRMQRPPGAPVDFTVAREIATREGMKAVVDGDIVTLGGSYVLSARLVSAQEGEELASFRETASEAKDIIPAISRLSKQLRARIGESLRTVQNAKTLEKVSTPSLEALQKYVAGNRVLEVEGDFAKGQALLAEAIALDTGFAMAYRKLAIEFLNRGLRRQYAESLLQKAFDHRDRLSDAERYITMGSYYNAGPKPDREKSIAAYESLLEIDPNNVTALNNLSVLYRIRREFAKAEELNRRSVELQPTAAVFFFNLVGNQLSQGKLREAEASLQLAVQSIPRNPAVATLRSDLLTQRGQHDSAVAVLDSLMKARPNDASTQAEGEFTLWGMASLRGRVAEGLRHAGQGRQLALQLGNPQAALHAILDTADTDNWYRGDKERAVRTLERAIASPLFTSLRPEQRQYGRLTNLFALTGRPERAREMFRAWEQLPTSQGPLSAAERHGLLGDIALAERKYDEAVREYRAADEGECVVCPLPPLGRAYDLAGQPDSAVAVLARYADGVERPLNTDATWLAPSYKRLGELYDAKGDVEKAVSYLARFVALWKDADADLQPQVRKARERMQQLQRGRG